MAKYLCIWVRAYWFSVTLFSKWLPGDHIRFFGFWMAWFRQRNSSLLWNFSFKFHVHVLCGCRQKPNGCQLCHFKMAALWFWTMFNCNPPITHCHPLLWGGGILVDHWSTISSCIHFYSHLLAGTNSIAIDLMTMKDYFCLSIGQTIRHFFLLGRYNCRWLHNDFSITRAPENMSHKNIITIHFHIWTWYTPTIVISRACHGFSIKI